MSTFWNWRRIVLATALLLTLAAVRASHVERADAPAPVIDAQGELLSHEAGTLPAASADTQSKSPAVTTREFTVARIVSLRQMDETPSRTNVFAAKSFYMPPPRPKRAAMAPPPPPLPVAPPLPFTYMGMLREGGSTVIFVVNGEHLHSVRVGDVIDGTWRVEAVGSAEVTFVYLPMNEKQTLSIGGSS